MVSQSPSTVRLAALLLQRRGKIATIKAADVDLDQALRVIPSDRTMIGILCQPA